MIRKDKKEINKKNTKKQKQIVTNKDAQNNRKKTKNKK